MKSNSLISHIAIISLFLCLFYTSNIFAQPADSLSTSANPLADRLVNLIDKVDNIRIAYKNLAQMVSNEGVPGWDRIVKFCNESGETIEDLREIVNVITGRFIIFPKLTKFLSRFLDNSDKPLDKILQKANALHDTLSNNRSNAFLQCTEDSSTFENADYIYPCWLREWLGAPWVVLTVHEVSAFVDAFADDFIDAWCKQTINIVGEGGNLGSFKRFTILLTLPCNMIKEFIDHVDDDAPASETNANYRRLGYIHDQVDTVHGKVEKLTNKVDSLRNSHSNWEILSMRTRIEENLAGHGDHPHPIAIFQLPQQFGGYLDVAKNIVVETISNMLDAGQNIHNANIFLTRGNEKFTEGKYKEAYYYYSKSYGEATKK